MIIERKWNNATVFPIPKDRKIWVYGTMTCQDGQSTGVYLAKWTVRGFSSNQKEKYEDTEYHGNSTITSITHWMEYEGKPDPPN